jgi:hypothetical protein
MKKTIVLASLVLSATIYAQQVLPLPPETGVVARPVTQTAIPEQRADDLKQMSQPAPNSREIETGTYGELSPKEKELKRLLELPAYNLQTNKAPLSDVLALLADACKMGYIGLEKGLGDDVQISVNINKNPYEILKYLGERYNVSMEYQDGIWHFGIFNDNEIIARVYHLRYNTQESVGTSSNEASSTTSSSSDSSGLGGSTDLSSSLSSSSADSFNINRDVIVKDIEKFLDISSDNPAIMTAPDFDVAAQTEVKDRAVRRVLPGSNGGAVASDKAKGKVIYNSDTHSLYILASRAQHQWIEKYITTVDKPQQQILVEAKIFETGLTPEKYLGFQWSGSLGSSTVSSGADMASSGGLTAILSSSALTASLQALNSNSNSVSVQYPRQVTVSNRSVTMSAVEKVPVQDTSTETDSSDSSSTTQTDVEYIDVGTNITILPRVLDDNKVQMNISIKVSSIARYETIGGEDYPVVAERNYKTEAIVENGYTLAIGGLKGNSVSDTSTDVPVLSKIPLVGALFRQHDRSRSDTNLIIFISPAILGEYKGGVKTNPQFILPRDKDYSVRKPFTGDSDASYTDVMLALGGMDRSIKELAQQSREGISLEEAKQSAQALENEIELIQVRLREIALKQPDKDVTGATRQTEQYLRDIHELRRSIDKQDAY